MSLGMENGSSGPQAKGVGQGPRVCVCVGGGGVRASFF